MNKAYLGDSVYVELTQYGDLKLTTENGGYTSNIIIIGIEELRLLAKFVEEQLAANEEKCEP